MNFLNKITPACSFHLNSTSGYLFIVLCKFKICFFSTNLKNHSSRRRLEKFLEINLIFLLLEDGSECFLLQTKFQHGIMKLSILKIKFNFTKYFLKTKPHKFSFKQIFKKSHPQFHPSHSSCP